MTSISEPVDVLPLQYAGEPVRSVGLARTVGWIAVGQVMAVLVGTGVEWASVWWAGRGWVPDGAVLFIPAGPVLAGGLLATGRRPRGWRTLVVAEIVWVVSRLVLLAIFACRIWPLATVTGGGGTPAFQMSVTRSAVATVQSLVLPVAIVVLLRRPEVRAAFSGPPDGDRRV